MSKLELGPLADDKPVKISIELPAAVRRDLVAYAEVLGRLSGQPVSEPAKLIVPMITRFTATDRAFAKARHGGSQIGVPRPPHMPFMVPCTLERSRQTIQRCRPGPSLP